MQSAELTTALHSTAWADPPPLSSLAGPTACSSNGAGEQAFCAYEGCAIAAGVPVGGRCRYCQDVHHQPVPVQIQPGGEHIEDHHLLLSHHPSDLPNVH